MVDASNGLDVVAVEALAVLPVRGLPALALFTLAPHRRGSTVLIKSVALLVLGCMILDFPVRFYIEDSLLFGLAFLVDGAMRIATASIALSQMAAGRRRRRARALSWRVRDFRLAGGLSPDRAVLHRRGVAAVRLDDPQDRAPLCGN